MRRLRPESLLLRACNSGSGSDSSNSLTLLRVRERYTARHSHMHTDCQMESADLHCVLVFTGKAVQRYRSFPSFFLSQLLPGKAGKAIDSSSSLLPSIEETHTRTNRARAASGVK